MAIALQLWHRPPGSIKAMWGICHYIDGGTVADSEGGADIEPMEYVGAVVVGRRLRGYRVQVES